MQSNLTMNFAEDTIVLAKEDMGTAGGVRETSWSTRAPSSFPALTRFSICYLNDLGEVYGKIYFQSWR